MRLTVVWRVPISSARQGCGWLSTSYPPTYRAKPGAQTHRRTGEFDVWLRETRKHAMVQSILTCSVFPFGYHSDPKTMNPHSLLYLPYLATCLAANLKAGRLRDLDGRDKDVRITIDDRVDEWDGTGETELGQTQATAHFAVGSNWSTGQLAAMRVVQGGGMRHAGAETLLMHTLGVCHCAIVHCYTAVICRVGCGLVTVCANVVGTK